MNVEIFGTIIKYSVASLALHKIFFLKTLLSSEFKVSSANWQANANLCHHANSIFKPVMSKDGLIKAVQFDGFCIAALSFCFMHMSRTNRSMKITELQ